jgi:hypothetical protein
MNANVGSINIHNVTAENLKCELMHLEKSTCISIIVGMITVHLYMDNDQAIAVKRILGA